MVSVWGMTDIGLVRRENQDAYEVRAGETGHTICVVCDGMGGPRGGRLASELAVERFLSWCLEHLRAGMTAEEVREVAEAAVAEANSAVYRRAQENPGLLGMGTTLVSAIAWEEAGGSGQPASKLDTNAELCAELCTRTAKSLGAPVIAIPHSVHVVLLFGVPGQDREDNIRQYTEELHEALSAHFSPGNLLIVVSGVVENITRIAEAYRDVQSLSRVLRGTGPLGSPVFVEDYSVFYLLEKYVDRQDLADFAQKALGELMAYDSENHSHLLQTLDVYFSRSGSITEVAKQMYIHRNTCVYRLEKIKAILHDDFSNPMKLLRYQIALLALKIIEH